jgi:hypothetical protein
MRVVRDSNAANATKESAQAGFSHGLQDLRTTDLRTTGVP